MTVSPVGNPSSNTASRTGAGSVVVVVVVVDEVVVAEVLVVERCVVDVVSVV